MSILEDNRFFAKLKEINDWCIKLVEPIYESAPIDERLCLKIQGQKQTIFEESDFIDIETTLAKVIGGLSARYTDEDELPRKWIEIALYRINRASLLWYIESNDIATASKVSIRHLLDINNVTNYVRSALVDLRTRNYCNLRKNNTHSNDELLALTLPLDIANFGMDPNRNDLELIKLISERRQKIEESKTTGDLDSLVTDEKLKCSWFEALISMGTWDEKIDLSSEFLPDVEFPEIDTGSLESNHSIDEEYGTPIGSPDDEDEDYNHMVQMNMINELDELDELDDGDDSSVSDDLYIDALPEDLLDDATPTNDQPTGDELEDITTKTSQASDNNASDDANPTNEQPTSDEVEDITLKTSQASDDNVAQNLSSRQSQTTIRHDTSSPITTISSTSHLGEESSSSRHQTPQRNLPNSFFINKNDGADAYDNDNDNQSDNDSGDIDFDDHSRKMKAPRIRHNEPIVDLTRPSTEEEPTMTKRQRTNQSNHIKRPLDRQTSESTKHEWEDNEVTRVGNDAPTGSNEESTTDNKDSTAKDNDSDAYIPSPSASSENDDADNSPGLQVSTSNAPPANNSRPADDIPPANNTPPERDTIQPRRPNLNPNTTTGQARRQRKTHKYWTSDEVAALKEGLGRYKGRSWINILKDYSHRFNESRTNVDLRDKARNEIKQRRARGEPLEEFSYAV